MISSVLSGKCLLSFPNWDPQIHAKISSRKIRVYVSTVYARPLAARHKSHSLPLYYVVPAARVISNIFLSNHMDGEFFNKQVIPEIQWNIAKKLCRR